MFCENVAARESRAISHHSEKGVFSVRTDQSHVGEIDDQFPPLKFLLSNSPSTFHLSSPGRNQLALQDQPAMPACFNDRNPEHYWFRPTLLLRHGRNQRERAFEKAWDGTSNVQDFGR